jgi:hypothetical protein
VSSYYPVDEKFSDIASFLKRYGYDENEDYSKEIFTPETLWVSLKLFIIHTTENPQGLLRNE